MQWNVIQQIKLVGLHEFYLDEVKNSSFSMIPFIKISEAGKMYLCFLRLHKYMVKL